jgi:hypothetical protein
LWKDSATTVADRQTIIRHLVDRVVVEIQGKTEFVDVTIHWAGGYVSHHEIIRPVGRLEQMRDYDRFVQRMLELYEAGVSSPKIAAQLNQEGYRTPRSRAPFTDYQIRQLLQRRGLVRYHQDRKDKDQLLGPHEWWVTTLAEHLGIPASTIRSWRRRGCIGGRQLPGAKGAWILWADEEEVERLRQLHSCQRSWKHQAPAHLTAPRRKKDEEHNTGGTTS